MYRIGGKVLKKMDQVLKLSLLSKHSYFVNIYLFAYLQI